MAQMSKVKYLNRTKPTKTVKRGSKDKQIKQYRGQGK